MTFENLERRMARTYMDMFPSFVPENTASVSVFEQKQFYGIIKNLYQLAFDEPLLFVAALNEDDAYPSHFTKSSYGKPKLQTNMKKFTKAMDELLQNMYQMGRGFEVKPNNRQKVILSRLGIDDFTSLPAAWVWMSTRPDSSLTAFSHCLFNNGYPYTSDIYARLLGEPAFRKLENWMTARGYKRFDMYDITASDCKLSLTYANPAWSGEPPAGGFEYKIRHTGISARYDIYFSDPAVFGLCIPNGLKPFLEAFDSAGKSVQKFMTERTKKCDGCKYCVQTDKTGRRPIAAIQVAYEGKNYHLCPYFPGYSYCWSSIDDELAERLIEMLSFMDGYA